MRRPRGPRRGTEDTAERVLAAARRIFADDGYARASIRKIASRAEVDTALVHYYYHTKENLFLRAVDTTTESPAGHWCRDDTAVIRLFLGQWERADNRDRLVALLRSLGDNEHAARTLSGFLHEPGDEPPGGALLVGTHLLGLAILRYLLRIEPVASMPTERLVTLLEPLIQKVIDDTPTGEIPSKAGETG